MNMNDVKLSSCTCSACVEMCGICPCIPTPDEAEQMLDHGYGQRMSSREVYKIDSFHILCPSVRGHECQHDMTHFSGGCTFLKDGLCEIHDSGFKPLEGRAVHHDDDYSTEGMHEYIINRWDNREGRRVFRRWFAEEYMKWKP